MIPKRHAATFFDLFEPERRAINQLLDGVRIEVIMNKDFGKRLQYRYEQRRYSWQTIDHAHVHLIPRRQGDVQEPRGGVRGVIPGNAVY